MIHITPVSTRHFNTKVKVLHLIIHNCEECPYSEWVYEDNSYDRWVCYNDDNENTVLMADYHDGRCLADMDVPDWCTLPNKEVSR